MPTSVKTTKDISIDTVVSVLRGLDNSITITSLSSRLNVSPSTLNRTRTGNWPPSITLSALRAAFFYYKANLFDDDSELASAAIIDQLDLLGFNPYPFRAQFFEYGFDGLVTFLLFAASQENEKNKEDCLDPNDPAAIETNIEKEAAAQKPETKRLSSTNIAIAILVAALLIAGSSTLTINSALAWVFEHQFLFASISLLIAILPAILGVTVDAAICWKKHIAIHPDTQFSWRTYALVAKYGSDTEVIPGGGRFNMGKRHLAYHVVCNLLGMLCYLSLIAVLAALPDFVNFLADKRWIDWVKILVAVAFLIAYNHSITMSSQPRLTAFNPLVDNPDNYRFDRFHNIANTVHLTWTISLSSIGTLCLLAYAIENVQLIPLPPGIVAITIATIAFLYFANLSPYAQMTQSASVGSAGIGIVIASVFVLIISLACFKLCWVSIVETFVCAAALSYFIAWKIVRHPSKKQLWMRRFRVSAWYSIAFALAILGLFVASALMS